MALNKIPESWNDCGMNWEDPDPLNPVYYIAIILACKERYRLLHPSTSDVAAFRVFDEFVLTVRPYSFMCGKLLRSIFEFISEEFDYCFIDLEYLASHKKRRYVTTNSFSPDTYSFFENSKEALKYLKKILDKMTVTYGIISVYEIHPIARVSLWDNVTFPDGFSWRADDIIKLVYSEDNIKKCHDIALKNQQKEREEKINNFVEDFNNKQYTEMVGGIHQIAFSRETYLAGNASQNSVSCTNYTVIIFLKHSCGIQKSRVHILVENIDMSRDDEWYDYGNGEIKVENIQNGFGNIGLNFIEDIATLGSGQYVEITSPVTVDSVAVPYRSVEYLCEKFTQNNGIHFDLDVASYSNASNSSVQFFIDLNCEGGFKFRPDN